MTITISPEQLKSISIISTYVIGWVIACKILCYMSKRRILFWWPDDANDRAWIVVACATLWPIVGFHLVVWGCGYLIHKVANRTLFPLMKTISNVLFVPLWKQLVLSCEPPTPISDARKDNSSIKSLSSSLFLTNTPYPYFYGGESPDYAQDEILQVEDTQQLIQIESIIKNGKHYYYRYKYLPTVQHPYNKVTTCAT